MKIDLRDLIVVISASLTVLTSLAHAQTPTPEAGGKLVFAIQGSPETLDPQATTSTLTFQYVKSAYDTLVEADETGQIVPALAESYQFTDQDLTLTFHLRPGVAFHNGDPLTAADVQATFARIMAADSTSPFKPQFAHVKAILTPDERTVQFQLDAVYAPLLATLASGWSAILPKRAIAAGHDFSAQPLGTGPFQFKEWVRDDHLSYTKFPAYWRAGQPYLDDVEFKVVVEPTVQLQGLLVGEFDIIQYVEAHNVPNIENNPETKIYRYQNGMALVLTMNHAHPPLDNVLVRRAICYALDRQALLDIAYSGGTAIGAFIDVASPYYADYSGMYPFDPAQAKALLAEAGFPNGFDLTLTLPQNYTLHVNAGTMVQNMLKQVGINVTIKLVDWSTWISQVYRETAYDLTVIGHTGQLDPHGRLGGEIGYTNYANPDTLRLIAEAAGASDPATRKRLYADVQRLMAEDAMMGFIGTPTVLMGLRRNVEGFRMSYALEDPIFRETFHTK